MKERRFSPRYSVAWAVRLQGREGATFDVTSCDISLTGIGLRVTRPAVLALAQGGGILTPGDRLRIVLPGATGAGAELSLEGRVRHVRRLSQEQYQVGVWFADLTGSQQAGLAALIDTLSPVRG